MTRSPRFGPADGLYCELSVRYQSAPDPVSAPDQARREGKREMSAPRPYETDPFHPHKVALLISNMKSSLYVYAKVFQLFVPCGIHIVSLCVVHFRLPMRCSTSSHSKVQSHFSPLVFYIGTKYICYVRMSIFLVGKLSIIQSDAIVYFERKILT